MKKELEEKIAKAVMASLDEGFNFEKPTLLIADGHLFVVAEDDMENIDVDEVQGTIIDAEKKWKDNKLKKELDEKVSKAVMASLDEGVNFEKPTLLIADGHLFVVAEDDMENIDVDEVQIGTVIDADEKDSGRLIGDILDLAGVEGKEPKKFNPERYKKNKMKNGGQ